MPLYEYRCGNCGSTSEILVGVTAEESKPVCASCGSTRLQRKLSVVNFTVGGGTHAASIADSAGCACGAGECCGGEASHSCGAGCACGHS